MSRTEGVVSYFIFLATSVLGLVGAAWWVIAAPILALTALRYPQYAALARRFARAGERRVLVLALASSAANTALFVVLAFVLGRVVRVVLW